MGAYAAIVIQSFGYSTWQVQLLQMVTGVIQVTAMLSAVWLERRFKQTIWPSVAAVLPTIAGATVLCAIPFEPSKRTGLLIAWYVMYSFWAAVGLSLSLVSRNTAGQTKKSVVIALTFVAWAAGNSVGPQIFRKKDAPRYFLAFAIILACFVLLVLVLLALRAYYVWQNRQKEAKIARGEAEADVDGVHAFEDITDRVRLATPIPCSCPSSRLTRCTEKRQLPLRLLRAGRPHAEWARGRRTNAPGRKARPPRAVGFALCTRI